MEFEVEDAVAGAELTKERPVDCERLRRLGLAELLYHALVEWGGWDVSGAEA